MNADFTFPRPRPPVPRPSPAVKSSSSPDLDGSRESNALRASILDTALELGLGGNSLVADWMFNNPLMEEVEEEQEPISSPGLTCSPTSEESVHSQYRHEPILSAHGHGVNFNLNQSLNKLGPLIFQGRDEVADGSGPINDLDSDIPVPPTPSSRKLRKKRAGDGYESDGGAISESGKKKDKKKESSGEGKDVKKRLKEEKKAKKEERKSTKNFIQATNRIPTSDDVQPSMMGYETDGGAVFSSSISKVPKKSKTRFFKLSTKSSRGNLRADASNSVPSLPNSAEKKNETATPLPIAERFATTSGPNLILNHSMSSPTDGPLTALTFQPFAATSELTATMSLPSTFNRPATAPTSGSPSAFNVTHLHPKSRDSHSSMTSSSSSGSGPNQHHKPQKRFGLSPPLHSPPSSMQGHQHHGLRTTSSLSSLNPSPYPVISLPITRALSSTPAGLPSSPLPPHSHPASPLPPPVSPTPFTTSVAPLQINKAQRNKLHLDNLPLSTQEQPSSWSISPSPTGAVGFERTRGTVLSVAGSTMVRPKNPPTDGFGPRPAPIPNSRPSSAAGTSPIPSPRFIPIASNSSSDGLSLHPYSQGHPQRISQQSIIPSSDYIVPSPQGSPLNAHTPVLPSPNVLSAYYHHDHIPPLSSPAPIGPLPTPPSSRNGSSAGLNGGSSGSAVQFPSVAQLKQRMTIMRQPVQRDYGIGLGAQRGKEPPVPPRPVFSPTQSTMANESVSIGGLGLETRVGNHLYRDLYTVGNNGVGPNTGDIAKDQEEKEVAEETRRTKVAASRQSWIDIGEDVGVDENSRLELEDQEAEEPDVLYDILDRFESHSDESGDNHHSGGGERALERSHSFMAGKFKGEKQHYPDTFDAQPRQNKKATADVVQDVCGLEEDGRTVGDRTSRWSGSVYSHTSILDEGESEETRDRFIRHVEAMLDAERMAKSKAYSDVIGSPGQTRACIPPLPKMPDAYASVIHNKPKGNIDEVGHFTPAGRSWNKF